MERIDVEQPAKSALLDHSKPMFVPIPGLREILGEQGKQPDPIPTVEDELS